MVLIRETSWKAAQTHGGRDELQHLQEGIYHQMMLMLPDNIALHQFFCSRINHHPALHLQVLELHPYTSFLRLTYELHSAQQQTSEPEAHIRMYHDLRIAEVTSFDIRRGINRIAGPDLDPAALLRIHWRQNRALSKWLDYLLQQGHSLRSMQISSQAFLPKPAPQPATADLEPSIG